MSSEPVATEVTNLVKSEKTMRREFVHQARKGFKSAKELAHKTRVPRLKLVVHHSAVMEGVIGLWYLGLHPKDIAQFIGHITEVEIFGVIRRHILHKQDGLYDHLLSTLLTK